MPNPGDFDPAEAVQGARQQRAAAEAQKRAAEEAKKQREEAEERRREAQENLRRANILELLRYADKELVKIRNPIVSEFVVTESWVTRGIFGGLRSRSRHTRYYGSWLSLSNTSGNYPSISGLVKLRQPRAGYAFVSIARIDGHLDPRNVSYLDVPLGGNRIHMRVPRGAFRIFASLKDATEGIRGLVGDFTFLINTTEGIRGSVEKLTKEVTRALDFVETGQPPEPELIPFSPSEVDYS